MKTQKITTTFIMLALLTVVLALTACNTDTPADTSLLIEQPPAQVQQQSAAAPQTEATPVAQGAGQGQGYQGGRNATTTDGDTAAQPGNGQADGSGVPQVQAAQNMGSLQTLTGVEIAQVDSNGLTLNTDSGDLWVQLGPPNYWTSQGIAFEAGQHVSLTGFEDNGLFQAMHITIDETGDTLQLRDENGRPMWAGGQGKGGGSHN